MAHGHSLKLRYAARRIASLFSRLTADRPLDPAMAGSRPSHHGHREMARRPVMAAVAAAALLTATALPIAAAAVEPAGAVYTMTNRTSGNAILVFNRADNGALAPGGAFATRGRGTGGSLGNQSGVILDPSNRWLFAVNAGSNDVSVFAVKAAGLQFVQKVGSGGVRPVSLALFGNLLYVLNAGGNAGSADNLVGFRVQQNGRLARIAGSTRLLSQAITDPAQVGFRTDGTALVVTEKATNRILTFSVKQNDGTLADRRVTNSAGPTPFGFAFGKRSQLLVSEAFGGAPNAGAMSSYRVEGRGVLRLISRSIGNGGTATCWVALTNDGRFAFVTNTGTGTISSYIVGFDGGLKLLEAVAGATGGPTSGPLDLALTNDGRFLYALARTGGQIRGWRVSPRGDLSAAPSVAVPTSANGLAVR